MSKELIGQTLGRYHILEQLGEGGMATVYKAFDTRLERDVAVKVIRVDQFAPAVLERILKRFEREAKSLAKLSHPNIVGIIEYGEQDGIPFLVMEYLPGGTLMRRLGRPMPWQEAVRLILPIARGLAYAHSRGVVHRDVKPSNILIGDSGEPMLTDFGIAKLLETEETHTLTGTGIGVGTPEYMAPEQWTGQAAPQSDIYSLGIVLYELVTGRKPYTADTPAAILLKQATEPLPRPAQFVPGLPEKVEKALFKALANKPADRYHDMAAFASALENLLTAPAGIRTQGEQRKPAPVRPARAASVEDTQATLDQAAPRDKGRPPTPASPTPKKAGTGAKRWLPWAGGAFLVIVMLAFLAIIYKGQSDPLPSPTGAPSGTNTSMPISTSLPTDTPTPTSSPLPPTVTPTPTTPYRLAYLQTSGGGNGYDLFAFNFSTSQSTQINEEPLDIGSPIAWNSNNQIAYLPSTNNPYRDIFCFDIVTGSIKNITNNLDAYYAIAWAPDGQSIAAWIRPTWQNGGLTGSYSLYLIDAASGSRKSIYSADASLAYGVDCFTWFDKNEISYSISGDIWIIDINGDRPVNGTRNGAVSGCASFSNTSPGSLAVSMPLVPGQLADIVIVDTNTQGKQKLVEGMEARDLLWSPDNHYIAGENSTGMFIYVLDSGRVNQTDIVPGDKIWSPDSTKLVFTNGQQIQSIDVNSGEIVTLVSGTTQYYFYWNMLGWIYP